ncbi:MAG: hypothetical protein V1689_15485 [Pseudomonadota bacterium]
MGEIRSTLDIILEKTKGLTMTESEKEQFRRTEVEGKVRGYVQKFLDGAMNLEGVKREIASLGPMQHDLAREALVKECLDRMELEGENQKLLDALEYLTDADTRPLKEIVNRFLKEIEKQRKVREQVMGKTLDNAGIRGSAVIPNILADPEWARYLSETREELRQELDLKRKDLTQKS